jgi:hypothetical protein
MVAVAVLSGCAKHKAEKVQLWEDGPYWATTNIGAKKPWDYGLYFWWGDTVGYRRVGDAWVASDGSSSNFSFSENNTPTYDKDTTTLRSEGWTITKNGMNILAPTHDAAHIHWGKNWRLPTIAEFSELERNCDWIWTTMCGVKGYMVRGRGDYASACIFLPAAGFGLGASLCNTGLNGSYWSSVPYSDNGYSWYHYFVSDYHGTGYYYDRSSGQSVRPVQGFAE